MPGSLSWKGRDENWPSFSVIASSCLIFFAASMDCSDHETLFEPLPSLLFSDWFLLPSAMEITSSPGRETVKVIPRNGPNRYGSVDWSVQRGPQMGHWVESLSEISVLCKGASSETIFYSKTDNHLHGYWIWKHSLCHHYQYHHSQIEIHFDQSPNQEEVAVKKALHSPNHNGLCFRPGEMIALAVRPLISGNLSVAWNRSQGNPQQTAWPIIWNGSILPSCLPLVGPLSAIRQNGMRFDFWTWSMRAAEGGGGQT